MMISALEYDYIKKLVLHESAIALEPGKEYLAEMRLLPIARREGLDSVASLVARLRLRPSPVLSQTVVEAMTTNETSFFRDIHPFEALRSKILPTLFSARAQEKALHIWCAACSTGQEPYSVAILLRENFAAQADWRFSILATDISNGVLSRARQGRYTQLEVNRGLPAHLLLKYFEKQGGEWQIGASIRRMVQFKTLNLAQPWPYLPPADIVFMRNVLIYFLTDTKTEILERVRTVLRPDGFLFLGGAETTLSLSSSFERVPVNRATSYRMIKS
jgi:chemotaxis protein methyltransferase CheR